jgi:hypothetical protein
VSEVGEKIDPDPEVARLGVSTVPSTSDTVEVPLRTALSTGAYVSVFETVPLARRGAATLVKPAYPIARSLSHRSVDASTSNLVTVTGGHFTSRTQVTLRLEAPRRSMSLVPVVTSPTQMEITIPALDTSWIGVASLRVFDAGAPSHPSQTPIILYRSR